MTQTEAPALTILERLSRGDVLISDGATGTYLQQHGLGDGDPEEWNVTHPDVVQEMAGAYFCAGADMVLTNTFGCTSLRQAHYGFQDRINEFNVLAAQHARSQAPEGRFVVGSVGPTGEVIDDPLKDEPVSDEQVYEAFKEQIVALAKGGVDAVNIETMIDVREAKLAIKAARDHTDLIISTTMFFDKGPRGFFTMMGTPPDVAMRELHEAGADIVGANCGNGIDVMVELARELRAATDGYLLIHSNAGIPVMTGGQIIYPETPEFMADRFKVLVEDVGINIIGGCCGTTPDHIRALSKAIRG
ncbi:MAG: homocysteine S-methyltransferase family protein [Chloroflexi bacterium]|nr:homocysteine S-methyltransferase family protein [Chloroflexota bacterium]